MEGNRMEWKSEKRRDGMERNGMEIRKAVEWNGTEWNGNQIGKAVNGMERKGKEWNGAERSGTEWNAMVVTVASKGPASSLAGHDDEVLPHT